MRGFDRSASNIDFEDALWDLVQRARKLGPVFSYESPSRERIRIKRGTRFYRGFPNQLLTDSWAVGSRRADRWNALGYTTTNGIGSRLFCRGVRGMWAAPRTIIDS